MISIFLTEELERATKEKQDEEVIFYFCSFQDDKRNSTVHILRGMIYQLISKKPDMIKHALPYFDLEEKAKFTVTSLESLWLIFTSIIQDPELGIIYYILDGLDECEEGSRRSLLVKLVDYFSKSSKSTSSGFKLAIVSREILELHKFARVNIDPDNNEQVT